MAMAWSKLGVTWITLTILFGIDYQFSLVSQSCPTVWTAARQASLTTPAPRACSNSCPLSQWSNHLILCCPLLLLPSIFPSIRVFSSESVLLIRWPKYWSFSFSIRPSMNIEDWFPLGLTSLILQSKGLSRVFSSTTVQKHQFFGAQPSLWPNSQTGLSSVAQSCPTIYDPMSCSTPALPIDHQLPEPTQTPFHWVGDAIQPSHPLSSPFLPAFNLSQHQSSNESVLFIRWPKIGVSASASVLPKNIQDWYP